MSEAATVSSISVYLVMKIACLTQDFSRQIEQKSFELYLGHSSLRLSTGFVLAAFKVCEKMVANPRVKTIVRLVTTSKAPMGAL
jgi:hypothetical protein